MIYNTEARSNILEFLRTNRDKSFSAEEIFSEIAHTGVGKSTVFRQLSKLSASSEIKRITSEGSRFVSYQYVDRRHCASHLHLKCTGCGRLFHLDDAVSMLLVEKIKNANSFSVDTGAFIPGECESCKLGRAEGII